MQKYFIRKWIYIGLFTAGMGKSVSLYAIPSGPAVGYFSNGTPVFQDDRGGFCTKTGTKAKKINDVWCQKQRFTGTSGKISLWVDRIGMFPMKASGLYDDQDRPLPFVGFYLTYGKPPRLVFFHKASDMCILFPDTIATREELADRLMQPVEFFSDRTPIFADDKGEFYTTFGHRAKKIDDVWYMEIHFTSKLGEILSLWTELKQQTFKDIPGFLDNQGTPLPLIGYHRKTKNPVFLLNNYCLVWPNRIIATREELEDRVNFIAP